MQQFPDDFNQKSCHASKQKIQDESLCKCRQYIYDSTISNTRNGHGTTRIELPGNLGPSHEITLCEEILERFDSLDVKFYERNDNDDEEYDFKTIQKTFNNIDDLKKFVSERIRTIYEIKFNY